MTKHKITLTLALLGSTIVSYAAEGSLVDQAMNWAFNNVLIVLAMFLIALVGILLWGAMENVVTYQQNEYLKSQGLEPKKLTTAPGEDFLTRWYRKAWSLVPMDKEQSIDLGHDYDGIRELDNSLPPWWLYLFYGTLAFAAVYLYVYHFSDMGKSSKQEYEYAMRQAELQQRQYLAAQANSVDESNVTLLTAAGDLDAGKSIFLASCSACHGNEGQGGVGPNLTDDYWLHGGTVADVFKTIKYGVPEKGMISWKAQLKPVAMQQVSSYIMTLVGTEPAGAKEPQGQLVARSSELSANME